MTGRFTPRRRTPQHLRGECGICLVAGPDEFGQYELMEDRSCPVHGPAPVAEVVRFGKLVGRDDDERSAA